MQKKKKDRSWEYYGIKGEVNLVRFDKTLNHDLETNYFQVGNYFLKQLLGD